MKLGYIGVGKMGGPMAGRLMAAGHELVVFDAREASVKPFVERGARRGRRWQRSRAKSKPCSSACLRPTS